MSSTPESSTDYPMLWLSDCGKARVIRCKHDIQFIVQVWQAPKWRSLSYHTDWGSVSMRWSELDIPAEQPSSSLSKLPQEERDIVSAIMGL